METPEAELNKAFATLDALHAHVRAVHARVARLEAERDQAYAERNRLVALVARLARELKMSVGLRAASDAKPGDAFQRVALVELPTGQCSWHFPEREAAWFDGLGEAAAPWDGHDTAVKHARIERYLVLADAGEAERSAPQFAAPGDDTSTDVTPPADGGACAAPPTVKCDAPGCTSPPVVECGCPRCDSEDEIEERFHACEAHKAEAAAVHYKVRERHAKWYYGKFGFSWSRR